MFVIFFNKLKFSTLILLQLLKLKVCKLDKYLKHSPVILLQLFNAK